MINRNIIALIVFVLLSLFILLFPETGMIYRFGKTSNTGIFNGGLNNELMILGNAVTIIAEIFTITIILFFSLQFSISIQALIRLILKQKKNKGM